jgi:hypothetical protein
MVRSSAVDCWRRQQVQALQLLAIVRIGLGYSIPFQGAELDTSASDARPSKYCAISLQCQKMVEMGRTYVCSELAAELKPTVKTAS